MSRRANYSATLYCELSKLERAWVDLMKEKATTGSDANLARIALWSLADHFGFDMPDGVFDLHTGTPGRPKRTKNPKVRQHEMPRQKPVTPAADHPWRGAGKVSA